MLSSSLTFSQTLFPDLDLGDARRHRRFALIVQTITQQAGESLPQIFPDPAAYHACLRLFDAPQCSHENLLAAHQIGVLNTIEQRSTPVLLLHDTTTLDFSGHTTLEDDLGPIGNGGGRGWLAHQTLAVDPQNRTVFGLVSQILHVRPESTQGESVAQRRERENRESRLWIRGLDEMGPTPKPCHWIDIADRGADIFEFLQQLCDRKRQFVVRSCQDRALGKESSEKKAKTRLYQQIRAVLPMARWHLEIPAKTGKKARVASLCGSSMSVLIRPPHVKKGSFRREPLWLTAVRVGEVDVPNGQEPLEWILLTNEEATTGQQIEQIAHWYACRMQIEEYHKVQKSGASVEGCQVQSVEKMAALVAVLSVIAVAMMNLRLVARQPEWVDQPAESLVPREWVEVLSQMQTGQVQEWSVGEFWVELARLGGYLKNPKKHPPGWITLWRGWKRLQILLRYELSRPKLG